MFPTVHVKEYFNITNIDYYDVILGTLFSRRLNIVLDFTSPGSIHMGTTMVPRNLPVKVVNKPNKVANCKPPMHKPCELDQAGSSPMQDLPDTRGHGKVTFTATKGISMHTGNSPHAQHATSVMIRGSMPLPHDYTLL